MSEDIIAEALILRTKYIYKEKCSLNFGGYIIRVKEEFFSTDLPDLGSEGLSAPILVSYKGYISLLESNIRTGAF